MTLINRQKLIEHWPLAISCGYGLCMLIVNPLLEVLGINNLEIHYRLFVIFLFSSLSLGGLLWTILPLSQALFGITLMVMSFYMYKRKWGHQKASGFCILVTFIYLLSIGDYFNL